MQDMEATKSQEKVAGRFDKVLRYYWDGVPVPLMCSDTKLLDRTFVCRKLAYTPDYHGSTVELPLTASRPSELFATLCESVHAAQPASCRIGSHYSPYVGLFRFDDAATQTHFVARGDAPIVRVPLECCEKSDEIPSPTSAAHRRIRTAKMAALYKPLIKELAPLSRQSLRSILMLSSKGCTSISKEIVAREIFDVNEEYAAAEAEAIFFYMCLNPLFRRILAPLQVATRPEPAVRSTGDAALRELPLVRQRFLEAKTLLASQLSWNPNTREYFRGLEAAWEARFSRLQVINTELENPRVSVVAFLSEVSKSVSAVVSRIRIEFYACVEDLFFSHFKSARETLLLTEAEFETSVAKRFFVATEVFLVSKMRSLFLDALDSLVSFFDCGGAGNVIRVSRRARRIASLCIDLVANESFLPRAPDFSLLLFGIADLFAHVEKTVNGLPRVAGAVLRTLRLGDEQLNILSHVELVSYRSSITQVLEGASALIDKILSSLCGFCAIPAHNLTVVKTGPAAEVTRLVLQARQSIHDIHHVSRDVLFYGRLEINCRPLRLELAQQWEDYLQALIAAYQATIVDLVEEAKTKSKTILLRLQGVPSTVDELEQHLRYTEAAKALANELGEVGLKRIIEKVSCIEGLFIPAEEHVCSAIFEFKRLPDELRRQVDRGNSARVKSAPQLKRKLDKLRSTTRDYYRTLSTGVKELYYMFNLDTCDIAAQTCAELRKLVSRIAEARKASEHEAAVLGLPLDDSFDDYMPLLNHFEVIEQFWITMFESTKLRELYRTPVSAVNAHVFVERVREWRRLIHSAVRNLRAFPALVSLGREQELALAKFEELELFLELITTPGLRKSHWRDIAKLISAQLRDDMMMVTNMSVSVKRLLDAGLLDHIAAVAQIVSQARCDYEVENELEEMRSYAKRTHFVLEGTADASDSNLSTAQESRREMLRQIEAYVLRCRAMQRRPNIGSSVLKSVEEWVEACENSRGVLLAWDAVKVRWMRLRLCLPALRGAVTEGICSSEEARALTRSLATAADAFRGLTTVLRKPQFSLYTAMMQDTVEDFLLTIQTGCDEAAEVLQGLAERRRCLFPRFRFLCDDELLSLQSVQRAQDFSHVLPRMYPGIVDVAVTDGAVTAVVAADGAMLPLSAPLALSKESPDTWMQRFDSAVRTSLLAAVHACVTAYHRCALDVWLRLWCGQVTVLALRVLHTDGLRRALQLAGRDGLSAYLIKTSDLCSSLSRLAQHNHERGGKEDQQRGYGAAVTAALGYAEFALRETESALEWHVGAVAELDSTRLVQTLLAPGDGGICVRMMGINFDYGHEFLGHGAAPWMSGVQWAQVAPMLMEMELTRGVPFVRGGDDVSADGEPLEAAAFLFGRFFYRVELAKFTSTASLQRMLRGCVEVGTLTCLLRSDVTTTSVLDEVVLPLVAATREQRRAAVWQLPYGAEGEATAITVHPLFRLSFAVAVSGALPRYLGMVCPEVAVAAASADEVVHDYLVRNGVVSVGPISAEEAEFAALYRQLQAWHPAIFTLRRLRMSLREAFGSSGLSERTRVSLSGVLWSLRLLPRLMAALGSVCAGFFSSPDGVVVARTIETQIESTLLLPCCRGVVPGDWCVAPLSESALEVSDGTAATGAVVNPALERFTAWMQLHRRVLLVGPRFSGKTRLWRTWAAASDPLIISPTLISAAHFYGTATEPGYLSLIASKMVAPPPERSAPVVVMEDVGAASSFALFLGTWPDRVRAVDGEVGGGGGAFAAPLVRVVGTAHALHHVTPGNMSRFALMALPGPAAWEDAIVPALGSMPDAEWAAKVLTKLLPPLVERTSRVSPELVGSAGEVSNMFAVAQRAAVLCRRWYDYVLTLHTYRDAQELQDDDDEMPLRLFAIRCAVMAATWSVGLSLPVEDRDVLKLLLLSAEADVRKALAGSGVSGEVFPVLSQEGVGPLGQVVLPRGWMSFEEAAARTDLPLAWSSHRDVVPQQAAWSQVFALPSRTATLRAVECLVNCGQHVLFHAGPVSGKSTLLRTMRANESDWVAQVYLANGGLQPVHIQRTIANELVRRCDGRYSPTYGRRLVVCIDDLHLSPSVARDGNGDERHVVSSLAGHLIRFCDKFQALSTPAAGTLPTANVVFCGTTVLPTSPDPPKLCGSGAMFGCVDVRLPRFDSDEIACGVYQLCNLASSRRRTKGFPQACATFLDLVHGAYAQLRLRGTAVQPQIPKPSAPSPPLTSAPSSLDAAALAAQRDGDSDDGVEARGPLVPCFYADFLRDAMGAVELVRLQLLGSISDVQVSTRVFLEVTAFYEERLRIPAPLETTQRFPAAATSGKDSVVQALYFAATQAADGTMRECVRSTVDFEDLLRQLPTVPSPNTATPDDESFVADCIAEFPDSVQEEREEALATLGEKRGPGGGTTGGGKGTTRRAETWHTSVLLMYPDSLKTAAVRAEGHHRGLLVRRSSSVAVLSALSSRHSSFTSNGGGSSIEAASSAASAATFSQQRQRPTAPLRVTPTYQTTWLTTRLVYLQDTLSDPGSHVVLLGEDAFGLRRLFRLWCAGTHVPLVWFRAHPRVTADEISTTFFKELRSAITLVCMNSIHAVLYLPPDLLRSPAVLRVIDLMVRSGDVATLFTDAERDSLMRGLHVTHPRSLTVFSLPDDTVLRDRLRGCLNFVFHLRDSAEMEHLAASYPFLRAPKLGVLQLHTETLRSSLMQEMALSVLRSGSGLSGYGGVEGIPRLDGDSGSDAEEDGDVVARIDAAEPPVILSQRAVCGALCLMFTHVSSRYPTSLTQLIELVALYRDLSETGRVRVLETARTGVIIKGRGDEAVAVVKAGAQRMRVIADEQTSVQSRVGVLTKRLEGEEAQLAMLLQEAQAFADKVQQEKVSLEQRREAFSASVQKVDERLEKAARVLRKAKMNVLRALTVSRVPDKGPLLVRAVYAVIGEDLPKHGDSPNELWSITMKRICTKEFAALLTAIPPVEDATTLGTFLSMRQELDAVRYGPALPYAQLLADFVVAWVDCAEFQLGDYAAGKAEIVEAERHVAESEGVYASRQTAVRAAGQSVSRTESELEAARHTIEALQHEHDELTTTEERLLRYTGLVDHFARFLAPPADVATRKRFARCVAADTLLVSAFYALLAMHAEAADAYASLQRLLLDQVHPRLHSTPVEQAFSYLLYQTHVPRTRALALPGSERFAWELRALTKSLFKRLAWRWTLVGGATAPVEHELQRCLTLACSGCVTVSMTDPTAKEQLVSAMRSGEGVLLRDVDDANALDFIRYLNSLYGQLKERWKADAAVRKPSTIVGAAKSSMSTVFSAPRPIEDEDAASARGVSLLLEGREIRVHPGFFMVCMSTLTVSPTTHGACDAVNVYNLFSPMSRRDHYEYLLRDAVCTTAVSTKMCSMREEVYSRQQGYYRVLQDFMQVHDSAAKLLSTSIADIRDGHRGSILVTDAENALAGVDQFEGQLAQTTLYAQSWQKAVQDAWDVMLPAVEAVATFAELIEVEKLHRPWHAAALDGCLSDMARFPPAFLRRFAPLAFSDLPGPAKCFYALANYVLRVVDQLSAGWPVPVKGVYSLLLLASAMAAAPTVCAAVPEATALTLEQTRVLQQLLRDGPVLMFPPARGGSRLADAVSSVDSSIASSANAYGADVRRGMFALYAASSDPLLRHVARRGSPLQEDDGGAGDEVEAAVWENNFYVVHFFSALAELHIEQASHYATSLFTAFTTAVTGMPGAVATARRPAHSPERHAASNEGKRPSGGGGARGSVDATTRRLSQGSKAESVPGSVPSGDDDAGEDAALRQAVPVGKQLHRAAQACEPLCVVSDSPLSVAVAWLRQEAEEAAFTWLSTEVSPNHVQTRAAPTARPQSAASVAAAAAAQAKAGMRCTTIEAATETLLALTRQARLAGKGACVCLALVVSLDTAGETAAATEHVGAFRLAFQRLLSVYATSMRLAACKAGTAFSLAVVCSSATEKELWAEPSAFRTVPCCYIPISTVTPQQRLLELLHPARRYFTHGSAVQVCESIQQTLAAELAGRSNRAASHSAAYKTAAAKAPRVRGPALAKLTVPEGTPAVAAPVPMPLPPLPPTVSFSAISLLQRSMEELVVCMRLVHYELVVCHVAASTRARMQREDNALGNHVDNPTILMHLQRLMAAWVMHSYKALVNELTETASESAPRVETEPSAPTRTPRVGNASAKRVSLVVEPLHRGSPPSPSTHRDAAGRQAMGYATKAYYYLRRHQPAWQLLVNKHLQAAATTAPAGAAPAMTPAMERYTQNVLSLMAANVGTADAPASRSLGNYDTSTVDLAPSPPSGAGAAADPPASVAQERSRQRSAQRALVERAVQQWHTGLFAIARHFAFFFASCRHSSGAAVLPAIEQQALWTMLRALVGFPENADEVPCLWGQNGADYVEGGEEWQPLLLDMRHLDHFRGEVDMYPTDLMEVCGEAAAARRLRRVRLDCVVQLCFADRGDLSSALLSTSTYPLAVEVPENPIVDSGAAGTLAQLLHKRDEQVRAPVAPAAAEMVVLAWEEASLRQLVQRPLSRRPGMLRMLNSFMAAGARHGRVTAEEPHTQVWLPSLRHPLLDLQSLTTTVRRSGSSGVRHGGSGVPSRAHVVAPSQERPFAESWDDELREESGDDAVGSSDSATANLLTLVVTQRRYLLPLDVVLAGARLSPALERQLEAQTQCSMSQDVDEPAAGPKGRVIVVRQVLLRRRRQTISDSSAPPAEEPATRETTHEVGVRMWTSAPRWNSPGLSWMWRWCAATMPRAPAEALLWDTAPMCRATAARAAHFVPGTRVSESPPMPRRANALSSAFVTDIEEAMTGELSTLPAVDAFAPRAWRVTEVPVPVRWRTLVGGGGDLASAAGAADKGPVGMELTLCVEYEPQHLPRVAGGTGDGSEAVDLSPLSTSLVSSTEVSGARAFLVWERLQIFEALDSFVWID